MVIFETKPLINAYWYDIAINRIDSRIGIDQVVITVQNSNLWKMVKVGDFIEQTTFADWWRYRRRKTIPSHVYHLCSCLVLLIFVGSENSDLSGLKKSLSFMVESLPVRSNLVLGKTWSLWETMNSCLPLPRLKNFTYYGWSLPNCSCFWRVGSTLCSIDYSLQAEVNECSTNN